LSNIWSQFSPPDLSDDVRARQIQGNADGHDEMCNCIRQAKVSGKIKEGRLDSWPISSVKRVSKKVSNLSRVVSRGFKGHASYEV
jgi:hypothetical protein